ncbi:interaptin-like [Phoenix dactylifera]|uniref:Interaptin-like n=1 Tax=Phoenix dactylifera TaxID=42345 RepID=A0A8B9A8C3_PHODC|nr:interaptin-like [Phoenix dactylifera]
MFKVARWRSEKNKIKAVFKFQFQATQVPRAGWEMIMVTLVPVDTGRPTAKSEKVAATDGTCRWANPIYETVRLVRDPKTGRINEKVYRFLVSTMGSTKAEVLGEVTINMADYAEVFKPSSVSLPLKASDAGAILHVSIPSIPNFWSGKGDGEGRETSESGDTTVRQQQRTLLSELSRCDEEEVSKAIEGTNSINSVEDTSIIDSQGQLKFSSSRNLPLPDDSNDNLRKSHSFDAVSALGSDTSSVYTAKENGFNHKNIHQDSPGLLSLLSNSDTPQKLMTSSSDWSGSSAPDRSTDGSTNNSEEAGMRERLQDPDETLEKLRNDIVSLTRKVEVSDLELQTLRKQIVKENRRGQDLSTEISSLKEERDALRRECEELKLSQKRMNDDKNFINKLQPDGEDPCSMLEEIKKELNYENNMNANLRLQLQKTQEANSELLLAVRDLDELLEHKNREISSNKCSKVDIKEEINGHFQKLEFGNKFSHLQNSEYRQEILKKTSEHDSEKQYALDALVKEGDDMKVAFSLEKKIKDLNSEVELYKKDREDLEIQMEQLALEYEILKQENHDISSKLEQTQLREQLRMQYECSVHLATINDLETHVESLEKELQSQAEAFEADIATLTLAKVEQEKRAIKAEETLRETRWNTASTAEQLQEEFRRLSEQMISTFHANEKLVMQRLDEASELRLQKSHMEELLQRTSEELVSVKGQYCVKTQQLLNLIGFKSKETDRQLMELKDKREELEKQKKYDEARTKASSEEMLLLRAEIEELKREKNLLAEQIEQKEKLVAGMELLKTSTKVNEKLLQDKNLERDLLAREITSLKEEVNRSLAESNELRHVKDQKETMIRMLNSEAKILKVQISDLKISLSEDLLEKENLMKQVSDLRSDLQKKEDMITSMERKLEGYLSNKQTGNVLEDEVIPTNIESFNIAQVQNRKDYGKNLKFVSTDNIKNSEHHDRYPRMGDKKCRHEINGASKEPVISNNGANSEKGGSFVSCSCDQHKIAETLSEMAALKKRNWSMEAELKEMQERYSEISLKFAEVEGERHQLVKTIRTLKNALKN